MKKILLSLLVSTAALTTLSAEDLLATTPSAQNTAAIHTGWYMGLGLGATAYSDDDMGKDFQTQKFVVDQKTSGGFKLYGGYKFNTIVGVEGSFVKYGTFNFKNESGPDTISTEIKPLSLNVAANLGYDFLDDQLRPFALVGLGVMNFKQSGNLEVYSKDYGAALIMGLGVEYTPKMFKGIGFRATLENDVAYTILSFSKDPTKEDQAYANSASLLSLGVNYKF